MQWVQPELWWGLTSVVGPLPDCLLMEKRCKEGLGHLGDSWEVGTVGGSWNRVVLGETVMHSENLFFLVEQKYNFFQEETYTLLQGFR